ncbi:MULTISPECIES: FMN-binding protein [Streptococcus]|uniref:FMN-binding domain-containing protein n=3 Tax=Streptococcus suis TaxID=1307 RepID=A0A0Z8FFM9_STRSU|nr:MULTISPECIES: FMN-binding protein [Streptococcus]HEM3195669.1 FMN-binding protein [Streptococcus suis 10581]ATZ04247.1 FMN-binding domain-containing protein [Streptococcus suis]AUA19688.1 FMN-binding domain-containing protein [Streptococcus suis]EHC02470.1 major membrane immunogen, membrane-anchored lipoprotein [Streptococcus suis R61]MBL1124618.1 FMN-binding protein [Streptococcus suis]
MKTTKVVLKSLVVLGAVFALAACGSKQESTSTSSSTTETVVLKDGTYKAESGKDDYGYKIVHTLTVKDGKISESKFDYEAEDGSLKSANEEYNKNMKDKAGVSAGEAIEQLNAALVKEQDLSAVEVVSGATQTSEDFKKSTEALLAAAAEGKTETVKLD